MSASKDTRQFSTPLRETNRRFLPGETTSEKPLHVAFILLEHFSMMAFTAAVDALVTANLVRTAPLFSYQTVGLDSTQVKSDLGIEISTGTELSQLQTEAKDDYDMLIVCGGYRCSIDVHPALTEYLKSQSTPQIIFGGLWNGAIALAQAGLMDDTQCAIHPENHAFLKEKYPKVHVSDQIFVTDNNRISCAGPNSALEMMLKIIERLQGKDIVRAIREILSCDQLAENSQNRLTQLSDKTNLPESLRELIQLMTANIEEPLSVEELCNFVGVSRRQAERLFQNHLETSPSKYYLELRITQARRLLLQTSHSITDIALACGFVSSSHFSNCYKDYFGTAPTFAREQHRQ